MQYSFDQLLDMLLSLLEAAPACSSREQSFEQLRTLWLQTHSYFAAPETELRRLAGRRLVELHGWKDLDKDPCHLDYDRSEEHTSELQSHSDLVCSLLLEKKKKDNMTRLELSCHHCDSDNTQDE